MQTLFRQLHAFYGPCRARAYGSSRRFPRSVRRPDYSHPVVWLRTAAAGDRTTTPERRAFTRAYRLWRATPSTAANGRPRKCYLDVIEFGQTTLNVPE